MTEKELTKLYVKVRSTTIGPKKIKVIYLGNSGGFHFGEVVEAKARHVSSTGKKHPYPKYRHCDYRIVDEDGDVFPVSTDGISFYKGFYPVPENFELIDPI